MKHCYKCREFKELVAFNKNASRADGLGDACKVCARVYLAEYYLRNKDKANAVSKSYYEANKEAHGNAGRAWRLANKEIDDAYKKAYYAANRDRLKAASSARYAEKGESIRARQAAYLKANPAVRREIDNRMRAKRANSTGSFAAEDVIKLMAIQKGKCVACRNNIRSDYHVDHIFPLARGGTNDKTNLQLLCPTCNRQKHARHPVEFMQTKGFLI